MQTIQTQPMSIGQEFATMDSRHSIYTSSSSASKGLMNFQRPIAQVSTGNFSAIPTSPIIHSEPLPMNMEVVHEARPANIEVPAQLATDASDKMASETSSMSSFDSDKEKNAPPAMKNSPNMIKDDNMVVSTPQEDKKVVDVAGVDKNGETVGAVEVQGFGNRGHYLSEGFIIFKILEAKFRDHAKVDAKHGLYFKFRLGTNSKKTKATNLEGKVLKSDEEIKVKYSNQDQVRIKVKGKGRLAHNVLAQTRVSVVDVVMEGKQNIWAPLLKGDKVIGDLNLEMTFAGK